MTSLSDKTPPKDYTLQGGFMETYLGKLVDYAQGDFWKKADPRQRDGFVSVLSMIAANYVAILNPDVIVFSGAIFDGMLVEGINRRIACYIPQEIMPLILHDDTDNSGIEGLVLTCRSYITTGTQLVRRQGRISPQIS
jgi:hypothetical protein